MFHILTVKIPLTEPQEIGVAKTIINAIIQAQALADSITKQYTERHWTPIGEFFMNEENIGTIVMDDEQLTRFNNRQNHQRRKHEQ